MEIGDEIKQSKFPNEYHKAVVNIIFTGNWINSIHVKSLKSFGVSPQQFNILRILRGQYPKPATISLLQERMLDRMSNASRLIDKLLDKKLVERKECKEDRRQVDVLITKKGLGMLKEMDESVNETIQQCRNITETEAKMLNILLDKIRG